MALEDLRKNDMMAHLLDALDRGEDIGHYGRLVFAMVAHHFLNDYDLIEQLCKDRDCDHTKAAALVQQVKQRDYNPPRREKILEFQRQQSFPICPNGDDPDACNLYRSLRFPDDVYQSIGAYHEHKVEAQDRNDAGSVR